MTKSVADVITSCKSKNIKTYRDIQSSLIPCIDPNFIDRRVFIYEYNNERFSVDASRQACYKCKYMYFIYTHTLI